eukprot:gnl/TRDRNA2_/TRDRNA2_90605_c2_seq1.p1 gnl/TRDRNA2_/TRDRNA2_90605_c2~~gnl/TRDRNA2_/TRDRNA2_90605_c2_seq1.p1  ORF type:complete len:126 (-),score=10.51 gnl/TRDRNA2_/TRDRNA2_90605_c2_seq1:4-381(-)
MFEFVTAKVRDSHSLCGFHQEGLAMISWALSLNVSLSEAWSFVECVKHLRDAFTPLCIRPLLMECEQRGLWYSEVALLGAFRDAADAHGEEVSFASATTCIAAVSLAKVQKMALPDAGLGFIDLH